MGITSIDYILKIRECYIDDVAFGLMRNEKTRSLYEHNSQYFLFDEWVVIHIVADKALIEQVEKMPYFIGSTYEKCECSCCIKPFQSCQIKLSLADSYDANLHRFINGNHAGIGSGIAWQGTYD